MYILLTIEEIEAVLAIDVAGEFGTALCLSVFGEVTDFVLLALGPLRLLAILSVLFCSVVAGDKVCRMNIMSSFDCK